MGRGQPADIQLSGNGGKSENIVVVVGHLVGDKFLVFLTDQIILALINKQIAFEGRLLVVGCGTRFEAAVGGLDVAVAVVDADDNGVGVVVHKIHSVSFLPQSGDTKYWIVLSEKFDLRLFTSVRKVPNWHFAVVVLVSVHFNHLPLDTGLSESSQNGNFQFRGNKKAAYDFS